MELAQPSVRHAGFDLFAAPGVIISLVHLGLKKRDTDSKQKKKEVRRSCILILDNNVIDFEAAAPVAFPDS